MSCSPAEPAPTTRISFPPFPVRAGVVETEKGPNACDEKEGEEKIDRCDPFYFSVILLVSMALVETRAPSR